MKILLSEGCPIFREGIKFVLENEGHDVDAALSGEHLFNLFNEEYDMVILDLDFLGSRAIDLAKIIDSQTNPYISHPIKVVATYKDAVSYYFRHLFDAGISKPFSKEKLLATINKECENVKRFNDKRNVRDNGSLYQHGMV